MKLNKHIYLILLFLFGTIGSYAQTEEEINEVALELFEKEQFVEATPKYLQLLALNPRNHNYNYRYGTCLLFNSKRKDVAFKYLNYSVNGSDVEPEAFYYLGKAFHLTFQFTKAIRNFELYKKKAGAKALRNLDVDRQIEMCKNGKRLLQSLNELIVVNKKEIRKSDFFRLYDLRNIGGTILVTEEFQSKTDKKNKHVPLIHFPNKPRTIYYSSYGDGQSQKDIFVRNKLPNGKWSLPSKVSGPINTGRDEDFPYMHPNGKELYFCSKGHNSMGGYDIFKSVLNPATGRFGTPENVDFAISSPDDDVFYIVDSLDQNAYFASSRQSENGKLYVYQVRVERFPIQLAIIKGKFSSAINPDNKKCKIDIEDYASGKKMGSFTTRSKGDYLINLPHGGKYYFYVQVEGSNKMHKALVDIPYLKEFRPMKQKMEQVEIEASEKLKITNLFNDAFDDPTAILAEILKERSELRPNAGEFDLDSLNKALADNKILAEVGLDNFTPQEIEQFGKKNLEALDLALIKSGQSQKVLIQTALDNKKEIDSLVKLLESKLAIAKESLEPEKSKLIESSIVLIEEIESKQNDNKAVVALLENMTVQDSENKKLRDDLEGFNKDFTQAVEGEDKSKQNSAITKHKESIKKLVMDSGVKDLSENTRLDKVETEKEFKKLDDKLKDYGSQLAENNTKLKDLENALENEKKKKVKEKLTKEIRDTKDMIELLENEIKKLEPKRNEAKANFDIAKEKDLLAYDVQNHEGPIPDVSSKDLTTLQEGAELVDVEKIKNDIKEIKSTPVEVAMTKESVTEDLLQNFKKEQEDIENSTKTDTEKAEEKNKLNKRLVASVESELAKVETALEDNPSDETLLEKKSILETILSEKTQEIADNEQLIASSSSGVEGSSSEVEITKEDVIDDVDSRYEKDLAKIEGSNKTDIEKAEEKNKLNKRLVGSAESELSDITSKLEDNPEDKTLQEKKVVLETIISEKEQEIEENEQLIASSSSEVDMTKDDVIAEVDSNYENDLEDILNSDKGEVEKAEEKNKLNKRLVGTVEAELTEVNSKLKEDSDNKKLQEKKTILEKIISEKIQEITDNEQLIASSNPDGPTITEASIYDEIASLYDGNIADVENSSKSDIEKAEEKNKLNKDLLGTVESELEYVDFELEEDPTNANLLKRKEILAKIKLEKEQEIAENEQLIASSSSGIEGSSSGVKMTKEDVIDDVDSKYEKDLAKIEGSNKTDIEKAEEKNKLNKRLVGSAESELSDITSKLEDNPEDKTLQEKKAVLETIISEKEQEIAENEQLIASSSSGIEGSSSGVEMTKEDVIADVDSKYEKNLAKIEGSDKTDIEKAEEKNKLNKRLVGSAESELSDITSKLEDNPEDKTLQEKKAVLETIISEKEQEIAENEQLIASSSSGIEGSSSGVEITKEDVIDDVDSKYEKDLAKIEGSNKTDIEKAEEKNKLNKRLVGSAESELSDITSKLEDNPEDKALLEKKAVLETIISEKEQEIAENEQLIASSSSGIEGSSSGVEMTKEDVIDDVDSKYEKDLAKIEGLDKTDVEKAEEKNKLNKRLVGSAEAELSDITSKLEDNPEDKTLLEKKAVLETIISEKEQEIAENEQLIASTNTTEKRVGVVEVGDLSSGQYENQESKKIADDLKDDITYINELEKEADQLAAELANASEKDQKKIQKKIDKINEEKTEVENDVLIEATSLTQNERDIKEERNNELTASTSTPNLSIDPEKISKEKEIDLLKAEINALKLKVSETNDPEEKNRLLKEIFEKEQRLNILLDEIVVVYKRSKVNAELNNQLVNADVLLEKEIASGKLSSQDVKDRMAQLEEAINSKQEEITELDQKLYKEKNKKRKRLFESYKADRTSEKESLERQLEMLKVYLAKIEAIEAQLTKDKELADKPVSSNPNEATSKDLIESDAFRAYYENNEESKQLDKEMDSLNKQIEAIQKNNTIIIEEAIVITEGATDVVDSTKESELVENNQKLDDLLNRLAILKEEQRKLKEESENIISERNETEQADIRAYVELGREPIEPIVIENALIADYLSPRVLNKSIFRLTDKTPYTDSNPIPIDTSQPKGLVFKVQVGAFSKPIKPEVYKEFAPLSAEKIDGSRLIRYMVGYFNNKKIAYDAQRQVRTLGYSDAFVVAYCDGERISIGRANRMMADGSCVPTGNVSDNPVSSEIVMSATPLENVTKNNELSENSVENIQKGTAKVVPQTKEDQYKVDYYTSVPDAAEANQVEIVKGLFFTVQCGVYNRPVKAAQLFNITPLNSQLTEKNQIRYSSGMFNTTKKATTRRGEIRTKGISDAFVTAYMNGKRIPVYKARQLLEQYGDTILFDYQNKLLPTKADGTNNSVKPEAVQVNYDKSKVGFKVFIGKFADKVPGELGYVFLRKYKGELEVVEQDGMQLIQSKLIISLQDAEQKRLDFSTFGLKLLTIKAFYDGQSIDLEKAKEIIED